MNLKDIDFRKKENQTFKNWFKLMWGNGFIFIFMLSLFFICIAIPLFDYKEVASYIALSIPVLTCSVIGYKAFYQYWDDLKKGNSR